MQTCSRPRQSPRRRTVLFATCCHLLPNREKDGPGGCGSSRLGTVGFVTLGCLGPECLLGQSSLALPGPLKVTRCVSVCQPHAWPQASPNNTSSEAEEEPDRRGQCSPPRRKPGAVLVPSGLRKGGAEAQSCHVTERRHVPAMLGGGSRGCVSISKSQRTEFCARRAASACQVLPQSCG